MGWRDKNVYLNVNEQTKQNPKKTPKSQEMHDIRATDCSIGRPQDFSWAHY